MIDSVEYKKAMSGSEIARELGITRQAVSQTLKRTMGKVYTNLLKENITENPTETVFFMRDWLGVEDEEDIEMFFSLFPLKIRSEIKEDLLSRL